MFAHHLSASHIDLPHTDSCIYIVTCWRRRLSSSKTVYTMNRLKIAICHALLLAGCIQGLHINRKWADDTRPILTSKRDGEAPRCSTNAECLKLGLPVLKPSPRRFAARSGASSTTTTVPVIAYNAGSVPNRKRNLAAASDATAPPADSLGYLSSLLMPDGLFESFTQDLSAALQIQVDVTSGTVQNVIVPGNTQYPYLCATQGPDSNDNTMGESGSYNYLFLTQCSNGDPDQGPPGSNNCASTGSPSQDETETKTFTVNTATGELTMTWTNPLGTTPSTFQPSLYMDDSAGFIGWVSDDSAFHNQFGDSATEILSALHTDDRSAELTSHKSKSSCPWRRTRGF
ncbi:hypothetical protein BD324DRAFT_248871 [Kockovaella imperatae]|uniref:Uncharacterized protein n=1 Tax=Kockovaella imperatae TaxID=4999 RepID=A0A1Y1UPN6_9TREE|nr:hypothetical protein BD324DRAFT_248871 [Kockovaella imperatae]ORX39991.1 hypothetical protein BD324DRAFT_248871 [Kockovaella imperatae]